MGKKREWLKECLQHPWRIRARRGGRGEGERGYGFNFPISRTVTLLFAAVGPEYFSNSVARSPSSSSSTSLSCTRLFKIPVGRSVFCFKNHSRPLSMPEGLALVDCDIALARYLPSFHPSLRKRRYPSSLIRIPLSFVAFRFFVSALTHSIPHVGMSEYRYRSFPVPFRRFWDLRGLEENSPVHRKVLGNLWRYIRCALK